MNERQFDHKGSVYRQGRPAYPPALFERLQSAGLLASTDIAADVGAGTGIFSRQLAAYVGKVYAVEPNDDMRAAMQADVALSPLCGSAESIPLPDCSVDVITAAQAFHWFDPAAFRAECLRLLRPNGRVLLIWNVRDEASPLIAENYAVNRQYCPRFRGFSNGLDFADATFRSFFCGDYQLISLDYPQLYNREAFVLRSLSSSFAPAPQEDGYAAYRAALEKLFDAYCQDGTVAYPYITRCYAGKLHTADTNDKS